MSALAARPPESRPAAARRRGSRQAPPGDSVDQRDRFRGSVYRLLSDLGHPVEHGEAIVAPALADRETSRALEVARGTPLQFLRQVEFDGAGRPVMLSLEWHVPAVIELRVYRRGPGPLGETTPG